MSIPLSEAVLLGVVQGITEFLPISSDGHLALAQMFLGHDADLALTVLLHAGTWGATLLILRKRVWCALEEGLRGIGRPSLWRETPGGRDAVVVVLATIPTAIVGFTLRAPVRAWSSSPTIIGACLHLSAVAVASTRFAPPRPEHDVPTHWGAVIVGLAQGAAVLPGLSRSAMTLSALLWLGVRAERSFELSFLMSLPAIAGALLLEGGHAFHAGADPAPLIVATLVSFIVGAFALLALRRILVLGKLSLFALYLVPLAIATLAWGYARP
jgi:undecaprenyl-diphosphatase